MYGVNEYQKTDSDLVKASEMLHKDFSLTCGMIAVDNQGEGHYILCDHQDMVYEFIPSYKNEVVPLHKTFLEYILTTLEINSYCFLYDN